MAEYKLTYFNTRGLAEPARYLFALAGVSYEDIRLPKDEHWPRLVPKMKAKFPWGVVPVLEYKGITISQSAAINRFLARQFKLAGTNDFESAQMDELVTAIQDWMSVFMQMFYEVNESKKLRKELTETVNPKYLSAFNKILIDNGRKHYVGKSLSWAEVVTVHTLSILSEYLDLKDYPALKQHVTSFSTKFRKLRSGFKRDLSPVINLFIDDLVVLRISGFRYNITLCQSRF